MSIITNKTKGSPINITDVDSNFEYIASVLDSAGLIEKDFDDLTGEVWNLDEGSNFRKLQLTGDQNIFTEGGKPTGVYVLDVKQPANGGKKLFINGKRMILDATEVTTITIKVGGFEKSYFSSASVAELGPRILSQSAGQTVIAGDLVQFFLRGVGIKKAYVYKDGVVIEEKQSPSFQFRMEKNDKGEYPEGTYQFLLENEYDVIWSDEMPAILAEAEPVSVVSDPEPVTVNAGEKARLYFELAGTPSPRANAQKLVNGVWTLVARGVTSPFEFTAYDTAATYRILGLNRYKVKAGTENEFDPEGTFKTFEAPTAEVVVKANKTDQPAPNPIEVYDDIKNTIKLGALLPGKKLSDYRVVIKGGEEIIPDSLTVNVGEAEILIGGIEVYYKENEMYNQSPSVFSTQYFAPARITYVSTAKTDFEETNGTFASLSGDAFAVKAQPVSLIQARVLGLAANNAAILALDDNNTLNNYTSLYQYKVSIYNGKYEYSRNSADSVASNLVPQENDVFGIIVMPDKTVVAFVERNGQTLEIFIFGKTSFNQLYGKIGSLNPNGVLSDVKCTLA